MKTAKMAEITSFVDASIVVYRGHSASKSSRDHKSWVITHENVKNGRNHEFYRCLDIRVSGVTLHRNTPRTTNRGLTHENAKNCRNHEFCRCLDSRVPGVTLHRNTPRTTNRGL